MSGKLTKTWKETQRLALLVFLTRQLLLRDLLAKATS